MYELVQAGQRTYYIDCPARMGIYLFNDSDVCLIDSGNDKDAGKKAIKILETQGWSLKMILNTHSHADHIGGNQFLQQKTGCPIYAPGAEQAFVKYPILESSMLYGGYPMEELRNKFLLAQESDVRELAPAMLPEGLIMQRLDGHSMAMAAFKTSDDVWFLADSLAGEAVLQKYHISYLYDVQEYLNSLEIVKNLQGRLFVPAHAEPRGDIRCLADKNTQKAFEIIAFIKEACLAPTGFDVLLKKMFGRYGLRMDFNQYVLVGSTIRAYLSYLHDKGEVQALFEDNALMWHTV